MALTDADRELIRTRHAERATLGSIARELGVHASTVSRAAKRLGLEWDREATEQATTRAKATNAEKRATLESRLLDEAGLLLDQLHQPHLVYNFGGRDNEYAEHLHDEPDVAAKRTIIAAAKTATDGALKLAEVDKASEAATEGKSLVGGLFAALQVQVGAGLLETDEDPATEG